MCIGICSTCNEVFIEPGSFEGHPCVTRILEELEKKE